MPASEIVRVDHGEAVGVFRERQQRILAKREPPAVLDKIRTVFSRSAACRTRAGPRD
jgi:hypothetical protein